MIVDLAHRLVPEASHLGGVRTHEEPVGIVAIFNTSQRIRSFLCAHCLLSFCSEQCADRACVYSERFNLFHFTLQDNAFMMFHRGCMRDLYRVLHLVSLWEIS